MPNSIRENNNDVRAFVATHDIQSVLDVGPGEGTYQTLIGDLVKTIDGVEIWKPNIEKFSLRTRYKRIWNDDIRQFITGTKMKDYDLIIFGDVLEHLSVQDAVSVFEEAKKHARWVLVSVPMQHFPQGPIDGNPAEHHEIEDPQIELIPLLDRPHYSWWYAVTGTFIYDGVIPVA